MVGKGGFEPPTLLFFLHNFNRLQRGDHKPCGSLWFIFLKSSEYAHNDRLIKFLVFIRLQRFFAFKNNEQEDNKMNINLFEDFKEKVECQLKQTESEIKIKSALALSEIEIIIESAVSVSEIIKFEKQYDEVERKFEKEIIGQREKIKKNFTAELNRLIKYLKKDCVKNKDNNFKKVKSI
jgi:hypothetical protein